jgi:hypothetical protein
VLLAFALGDLSEMAGVQRVDTASKFDAVVAKDLAGRQGQKNGDPEDFANSLGTGAWFALGVGSFIGGSEVWVSCYAIALSGRDGCRPVMVTSPFCPQILYPLGEETFWDECEASPTYHLTL